MFAACGVFCCLLLVCDYSLIHVSISFQFSRKHAPSRILVRSMVALTASTLALCAGSAQATGNLGVLKSSSSGFSSDSEGSEVPAADKPDPGADEGRCCVICKKTSAEAMCLFLYVQQSLCTYARVFVFPLSSRS